MRGPQLRSLGPLGPPEQDVERERLHAQGILALPGGGKLLGVDPVGDI